MTIEVSIWTAYLFFEIAGDALLGLGAVAVLGSVVNGVLRIFRS